MWREFLPDLDEGSIWLHAEMPPGISLQKATDMVAELRRVLDLFPEVSTVVSHIGRNDDGTDPWTPSHMEAAVMLTPYRTWPAGETKQDLIARMAARLDQLPGFEIAFSQPIMDSVLDYVFDPHSALAVKVFGDDFNELRRIGNDIIGVLNTVPGVTDAAIDQYTPLPQISIKVDRAATARYGINVADVANLISHRHRRRRRQPVLHRRAPLRHHGALPGRGPQQSRGDQEPGADLERRRAHSVVAGRRRSSCRPARA